MTKNSHQVSEPQTKSPDSVCDKLGASGESGLGHDEAKRRLGKVGPNRLKKRERRGVASLLLRQFQSVILWVLVVALVVALVLAHWPEAIAIAAVILVNTLLGFFAEWKATRTIDALQKQEEAHVEVLREGEWNPIPIRRLVPGDLIRLKGGELVPADARLLECEKLRLNEAALTGESEPVTKSTEAVDAEAPLAEHVGMLYKGCSVTDGTGRAIVTATGMRTELGRITKSALEAESSEVPLRTRLDRLGHRFVILVAVSMVLVGLTGWWQGREPVAIVEVAIALGIAAVPEGLPIVATIALAHGMWLMGRRNAVVRQLQAVQALGSVPYLFVDKTGTLTRNRMQLIKMVTPEGEYAMENGEDPEDSFRRMLEVGVLCNGAELEDPPESSESGDPMEIALLEAGRARDQSDHGDRRQGRDGQSDRAPGRHRGKRRELEIAHRQGS